MPISLSKSFRTRSYVCRNGRETEAQVRAKDELWPQFGLMFDDGMIDYSRVFGRQAPRFLEIGFGNGESLLALAKEQHDHDFIGIETHRPGIGALFLGMKIHSLSNLRVYYVDAIDVLEKCIPDGSLEGIQLFFPDPWQKRRHHARRLIQSEFVKLIVAKLKPNGILHLATDWEDYAIHMLKVLSQEVQLLNLAGQNQYSPRSSQRPVLTKFERRAERAGRVIRDLQFKKL